MSADAALVKRCLSGDPGADRELVERFQSDVLAVCRRLLAHLHDAEDVAQEVFLRVFRSLNRWDDTRPLRPWVLGIAVNRCRTWIGRRGKGPELADYLHEAPDRRPADDSAELAAEIRAAVDALRPEYRDVFVLFHEHGHPYEVIAEAVGRPVGTVKTWLHRARLEILDRLRSRGLVSTPTEVQPNSPLVRVSNVTPQVPDITDPEPVPPQCRATVERIQRVLDGSLTAEGAAELEGETSPGALTGAGDTHLVACAACRERVRAARVLLSVLALPPEPAPVPTAFTDRVLTAVAADRGVAVRRSERRERAARVTAWAALAAAIVVGMFYLAAREQRPGDPRGSNPVETAGPLPPAPVPRESPDPTPAPRPVRLGDEFAKAGQALRDAPKPLAESVAVAPKLFDAFTEPFKGPVAQPNPMGAVIEPARRSIAELPVAVRAGLEPVTGTAEKAFNRFLRDVGAAKPNS